MLGKLSVRNAKRQAKDYIIYFITVIISVALMFSFNSIAVSEDISELSTYMKDFGKAILGISVIIIFVMAWLINYTMKFMLEKRSKEFGTYQILGIEKKDISNMFTLENILIGSLAFVLGVGAGLFLNQFLTSIIMNLFNQPYQIQIVFDIKAVGLTALYFFGIFVLVLLNCRRKIKKTKVYNLLYADKKNENNVIKKSKGNIIVFITSLVLLLLAYFINDREFSNMSNMTGRNIFIALVMLIIGIYLFYISISSFIVKRYLQNKSRKYKKSNMFLYRNLTSKINTMSITMGTIALMFTFILVGGNVALLMNNMLNNEIEMGYPFEITMSSLDKDFSIYKDYINKNAKVKEMYEYDLYDVHNTNIRRALDGSAFESRYYYDTDSVMLLKDYNKLRQMLGYEQVSLGENEAIIHSMKTAEEKFEKYIEKTISTIVTCKNADKIEIIPVNDGSKDNTAKIINRLINEYSEDKKTSIFNFIDKENGGHGSTINAGLKVATGKYFRVIDGDDWINSQEMDKLIDKLENETSDIVITDYSEDLAFSNILNHKKIYDFMIPNIKYDFEDLCIPNYGFGEWGPILATGNYKTEVLKKTNFKLSEKSFYVDMEYNVYSIEKAKTITYYPYDIYRYFIGRSGQSVSKKSFIKKKKAGLQKMI